MDEFVYGIDVGFESVICRGTGKSKLTHPLGNVELSCAVGGDRVEADCVARGAPAGVEITAQIAVGIFAELKRADIDALVGFDVVEKQIA